MANEVIKSARALYECPGTEQWLKDMLLNQFPELAESEDERVRKFLVKHVSEWIGCIEHDLKLSSKDVESEEELAMFKAGLAYLEKQEKQKPAQTETEKQYVRTLKALVSDFIRDRNPEDEPYYQGIFDWLDGRHIEQKPAEKQDYSGLNDLERAIHRGFLSAGVENVPVTIIKETAQECLAQMMPAEWSDEGAKKAAEDYADEFPGMTHENDGSTIEDYDKPYNDFMAGVLWAKHQYQPKQEWSEEDENIYSKALDAIYYKDLNDKDEVVDSLKSLCDLISRKRKVIPVYARWKPSEEQIHAIVEALKYLPNNKDEWMVLNTLADVLRKLM